MLLTIATSLFLFYVYRAKGIKELLNFQALPCSVMIIILYEIITFSIFSHNKYLKAMTSKVIFQSIFEINEIFRDKLKYLSKFINLQ